MIADKIISWGFYAIFFLVPLVFTSTTSELFEYNKMMLTYGLTVIILAAWACKMVLLQKFIYRRTFLEIPLLLYLSSHILSTIFSIDPHISIWGYYSRFHEGLLASLSYILLYFAAVSNLTKKDVKNILYSSFISAIIVSIWGVMEHFGNSPSCVIFTGKAGVDCWVQDVQNRVFATLGQPNWMAAYLDVLILALIGFITSVKREALGEKFFTLYALRFALLGLFIFALYCTKSRSGYFALAFGFMYFILMLIKIPAKIKLVLCLLGLVGFLGFAYLRFENAPPPSPNAITDSESIRKPVWEGAVKIWKRYPVFGSGVETFAYSFYLDRPVSKNLDSEWDFLYNKAHNEYLNLLATTGTVGILAYLLVIASAARQSSKNPALFAALTTILITNFYGFSIVIIGLYFFLIPAWAEILSSPE